MSFNIKIYKYLLLRLHSHVLKYSFSLHYISLFLDYWFLNLIIQLQHVSMPMSISYFEEKLSLHFPLAIYGTFGYTHLEIEEIGIMHI